MDRRIQALDSRYGAISPVRRERSPTSLVCHVDFLSLGMLLDLAVMNLRWTVMCGGSFGVKRWAMDLGRDQGLG